MSSKENNKSESHSADDHLVNRSRSFSRTFKNLFGSNNSSETSVSQVNSTSNSKRPTKPKPNISTTNLNTQPVSNQPTLSSNTPLVGANNDRTAKFEVGPDSARSSLENQIPTPVSLGQFAEDSPISHISLEASSPLINTYPATPTLMKKPRNNSIDNNLIDEKLDDDNDMNADNDLPSLNPSDEAQKRLFTNTSLNTADRSSSIRGRSARRNNTSRSRDVSPQISSREGSLSPQRSINQYRSRGLSVSQANFAQPHLATGGTTQNNGNNTGHLKRSATLMKTHPHGDNRGVMVNTRHLIWESENFKLYRNFTHEHKLPALPLIDINPDLLNDKNLMKEIYDGKHKETFFSIGTLFKLHKGSQQSKEGTDDKMSQIVHNGKGYIPSKSELESNNDFNTNVPHCKQVVNISSYSTSLKKKKNVSNGSTDSLNKATPTIVNSKAAISKDELHLINDLTSRMKSLMSEEQPNNASKTENKISDFSEKYGYCAGTLGQGAYGVVKVTCRKLKDNLDPETKSNTPYVVDNIAKKSFRFRDCVFFAVKELQADKKNIKKKSNFESNNDEDSDDSDGDGSEEYNSDCGTNDSETSTGTSDFFVSKLNKNRKRKNRDYNAKFCTRLTSEFVIGHALNNIGRHPNILRIFDLYQYENMDNKFLQVMEFCPSGDLHSLIKRMSQSGNGRTVSRDVQLPPIGNGPVFVGDNLNLMDGGTGFTQKECDQLNLQSSNNSGESHAFNCLSPTTTANKLTGSQQNLLDSLIQRKQEKHNLLHPLEIDCFMKQLINGVSFMHQHGVAHCDLKPENILFKPNGILKISDFGTSCVFQTAWEKKPHYQTGCFGSEPYMAPEQFIPKKQYDPRLVDTFAVGVIYVTMAMGHYPWKSPVKEEDPDFAEFLDSLKVVIPYNAETKQQEIITGEYEPFEEMQHVNADMKMLRKKCLYRMLHPNPNKRVLVKDVLNSNWMKRTHCCVIYKNNL